MGKNEDIADKSKTLSSSVKRDLRECTRCKVKLDAQVRLANGILLEGQTENISLKGLFFRTEKTFPLDTLVKVHLYLTGTEGKESLDLKGTVVRIEATGMAIQFTEVDSDSLEHLRRLLIYNSKNEEVEKVHQELDEHIGIQKIR